MDEHLKVTLALALFVIAWMMLADYLGGSFAARLGAFAILGIPCAIGIWLREKSL